MERLNEKLWPIVKEYTRQVAELLGCCEWHWVGTADDGERPIDVCDFDGLYFLSLEDMQVIIDRLDDWVKRYGSKEAVAEEVRDWFRWWLEDADPDGTATVTEHPLVGLFEARQNRALRTRPTITLEAWLAGCPREPREPTIDDELRLLCCQRDTVKELVEKYRGARTMWNILDNLTAEIKVLEERVKERDAKALEELKGNPAFNYFLAAVEDYEAKGGDEHGKDAF